VLFYILFVCKCVLPPGDNPIAVNKYIISYHIIIFTFRKKVLQSSALLVYCTQDPAYSMVWVDIINVNITEFS